MNMVLRGGCACGEVKYEINNDGVETEIFSVYCADVTLLAGVESEESAIAAIIQSGLEYANLH